MRTSSLSRREFLASSAALLSGPASAQRPQRRAVVIMLDGFGRNGIISRQLNASGLE